jgi:thiamine pyrophosphokinase
MIECDVVILANGEFPTHHVPLALLESAPHIVACDGAISHLTGYDSLYHDAVAVGDGDSIRDSLRDRLIQVDEQEDNDLTKATRYCLGQGWRRICYLGATGKREDHTLGNISLLVRYYLEMGVEPYMVTDFGWFSVAKGDSAFESFPGQQVSIFNVNCKRLVSEGLKWQSYPYQQFWQGTLNEAVGTNFRLIADGCYLVYRTFS